MLRSAIHLHAAFLEPGSALWMLFRSGLRLVPTKCVGFTGLQARESQRSPKRLQRRTRNAVYWRPASSFLAPIP